MSGGKSKRTKLTMEETTLRIKLPKKIANPNYKIREIEIAGEKHTFYSGLPEYYSLEDKNWELLEEAFRGIEELAYSDKQIKSINDFLLRNYYRLCNGYFMKGCELYGEWNVYKRNDDILFYIYETIAEDMPTEVFCYLFSFLGGEMEVTDTVGRLPQNFGFEYQFNIYTN